MASQKITVTQKKTTTTKKKLTVAAHKKKKVTDRCPTCGRFISKA